MVLSSTGFLLHNKKDTFQKTLTLRSLKDIRTLDTVYWRVKIWRLCLEFSKTMDEVSWKFFTLIWVGKEWNWDFYIAEVCKNCSREI